MCKSGVKVVSAEFIVENKINIFTLKNESLKKCHALFIWNSCETTSF